jgi:hypothetical protein
LDKDLNIKANELLRHYKSLLTYSEVNVEDNFLKINRTAKKLATDYVKRQIELLNALICKIGEGNKLDDLTLTISVLSTSKTEFKKILQILETENE